MTAALWSWICVGCSVAAVAMALPPRRVRVAARRARSKGSSGPSTLDGPAPVLRWLWAVAAAVAAAVVVPLPARPAVAVVTGAAAWWLIGRREPRHRRRRREEAARELPQVVALLGAALRAGADPGSALRLVCVALPGAASDRLVDSLSRLQLGVDPVAVWDQLASDEVLAPLGRALARAHRSGISVAAQISELADQLAADRRAAVEQRAHAVGVRAAVPLGLCLLPAFVVLGIVPLVAALLSEVLRTS